MNQASDMLVIQSLAFFGKKIAIFRKNFKNDIFLNGIKNKTRQNKELKYHRKNIVWDGLNKRADFFSTQNLRI